MVRWPDGFFVPAGTSPPWMKNPAFLSTLVHFNRAVRAKYRFVAGAELTGQRESASDPVAAILNRHDLVT